MADNAHGSDPSWSPAAYGQYGKKSSMAVTTNVGYANSVGGLLVPVEGPFRKAEGEEGLNALYSPDQLRADIGARWTEESLKEGKLPFGSMADKVEEDGDKITYRLVGNDNIFDMLYIHKQKTLLPSPADGGMKYTSQKVKIRKYAPEPTLGAAGEILKDVPEMTQTNKPEAMQYMRQNVIFAGDFNYMVAGTQQYTATGPQSQYILKNPFIFKSMWEDEGLQKLSYFPTFRLNRVFYDYYFSLTAPFSKNELEEVGNSMAPMYYDIDANYNFLNQNYEMLVAMTRAPEVYLPNMYLFLTNKYATDPESGVAYLTTLAGSLGDDQVDILNETMSGKDLEEKKEFYSSYGSFLASNVSQMFVDEVFKNYNIGFSNKNVDFLLNYASKKNSFPMFVDFKMSTQTDTILAQSLKDFQFDYPLLKTIMQANVNRVPVSSDGGGGNLQFFSKISMNGTSQHLDTNVEMPVPNSPAQPPSLVTKTAPVTAQFLDLLEWLESYKEQGNDYFDTEAEDRYRFIGESQQGLFLANSFFKSIYTMIMKGKMKALANAETRDFHDIVSGKGAYNEIIAYKVTKHLVNTDGTIDPSAAQAFYFTNSNELKELNFIDTQVAFGRQYKYLVWVYTLVVGTEYYYSDLTTTEVAATQGHNAIYEAECNFNYRPTLKLVEVPYFGLDAADLDTLVSMWDDPPTPPEGQLLPIFQETNKLKIFLNGSTGRIVTEPLLITAGDVNNLSRIRQYQNLPKSLENKIVYDSDDPVEAFQIFRIEPDEEGYTEKPTSYSDFSDKMYKELKVPDANSGAMVDKLLPNHTYYYIFRSIDFHGNVSLPSALYEVKMLVEPGADISYPLINVVEFAKKYSFETKKPMRRFFHIDPKLSQKLLKADLLADPDFYQTATTSQNFQLGIVDPQLFINKDLENDSSLKQFKIRATSRETGRKVDFNIRFVWKHKTHYE